MSNEYYLWLGSKKWLPISPRTFDINVRVSNTHDYPQYHLIKTEKLGVHVFAPKHRWYLGNDGLRHQNLKLPTRHG